MIGAGSVFDKLRTWHLLLVLATLYGVLGIYQILPLRPQSVHQWAQCDRASVAWNYYKGYADFFHPRVNNTDNGTGITGLEFPIVQYFVSVLYRLFGFHEWLYRLTTLIVFTFSAISFYRLALYFIKDKLASLQVMLMYVCSPLLTFYSCSFLPDIYSLSFAMMAWSILVRYIETPSVSLLVRWFIALSIACLIKPNSMIHLPVMWLFLCRNNYWSWSKPFRFMGYFVSVVILSVAWYAYASWLSKTSQSEVFLLQMRPPKSWQEVLDVWEIVSSDWLDRIYHPVILTAILIAGVVSMIIIHPIKNKSASYALMMIAGCAGFLILMLLQLSYHDYYFITMFPSLLFIIFVIYEALVGKMKNYGRVVFLLTMLPVLGAQFYFAKTHLRTSHKKDNWKYGAIYNDIYFEPREILNAAHLHDSDQVIVIFDHSPNISLYLLGLKGVTIPYRKLPETLMGYLHTGRYRFVIFNPASQITDLHFIPEDFPLVPAGTSNGILIFKLSSSFHPDGRTMPLSPWN